jgi:RND family efflux transporter MFP subunit
VVEPWVRLAVMAEVRGKVIQKALEEGDEVKKGDLIAVLDSRDYVNAYNSAKALYDTALSSFNRYSELYKATLATRSQLDTATANMENAKASMETAKLSVDRCRIYAPFSGILNRVYFEKDQYINIGDMMAEMLQVDRVKVNVGIPESDVEAVRRLENFEITFDALNGKMVKGTKVYLSKTTETAARLYSLKLAVDNQDYEILPDMFARVEIVKREVTDSIVVPVYTVINRNDKNHVYLVGEDNSVSIRPIEMGLQESWQVEVTQGLAPGERLVVVGHRSVEDGQTVNVMRTIDNMEALEG